MAKKKAKKKLTFAEVEELAVMTYDAIVEFTGDTARAKRAAQKVWDNNPDV